MPRHIVAKVGEIPAGQSKIVSLENREIGVFYVNGEYFALLNRCPHQAGPLCQGRLTNLVESDGPGEFRVSREGEILRCPWHGWEFDIRTGKSYVDPTRTFTKAYSVSVETGAELSKESYLAETYSVVVEGEYVLVDL